MLKTPAEILSQRFRLSQKQTSKDFSSVLEVTREIESAVSDNFDFEGHLATIRNLKRKLDETRQTIVENGLIESDQIILCKDRLGLSEIDSILKLSQLDPSDPRKIIMTNRMIALLLLQRGYISSGRQFVQQAGLSRLVDVSVFEEAGHVEEAILTGNLEPVLDWCSHNASKLRRINGFTEFFVRLCQFLDIPRNTRESRSAALEFAVTHLSPFNELFPAIISQAISLLALTAQSNNNALTHEAAVGLLVSCFRQDVSAIYGLSLSNDSLLTIALSGLSSLKTPHCSAGTNKSCPVCSTSAGLVLSARLPIPSRNQSSLICSYSGGVMDDSNPPLVLPDNHVISTNGFNMLQRKIEGNVEFIISPFTGSLFKESEVRHMYVA